MLKPTVKTDTINTVHETILHLDDQLDALFNESDKEYGEHLYKINSKNGVIGNRIKLIAPRLGILARNDRIKALEVKVKQLTEK